jgi:flagellar motor protein MotB
MRNIIIGLSVLFFTLSGIITFKVLETPATSTQYQKAPEGLRTNNLSPQSEERTGQLAREQEANRALVEELQAKISRLEGELSNNNEERAANVDTKGSEREIGVLAVLGSGMFRSGQIVINEDLVYIIKELVPDIEASSGHRVIIEGHTDNIPISPSYERRYKDNRELSFLRAKAVADILVEQGISPERISVIGYGDTRPIASNETVEGRVKNRRVEVKLTPGDRES